MNVDAKTRYEELLCWLQQRQRVLLTFSGGVDSSLLAFACRQAIPDGLVAIMVDIPYISHRQRDTALAVAEELCMPLHLRELGWERMREANENGPDRCYHCKSLIYAEASAMADRLGIQYVLDGENADDVEDQRPGRRAAHEHGLLSPLRELGFRRKEVEELVTLLRVPVRLEKETCLATRISAQPLQPSLLRRIEDGESAIRSICELRELRLRHSGHGFVIQVGEGDMGRAFNHRKEILDALQPLGIEPLSLSLQPYRSHG
ncbi:MAG: hypothetical protein AB7E27_04125 [Candidatus Methanomethylophilaceae archaeon]|jgi:uncharacterized protein